MVHKCECSDIFEIKERYGLVVYFLQQRIERLFIYGTHSFFEENFPISLGLTLGMGYDSLLNGCE